jgi:hypothetical protein
MARFVKKRRSSSQDENVSLSHEQRMMPHPMNLMAEVTLPGMNRILP